MRPTVKRTINKSVDKTKRDREKEKEKEKGIITLHYITN